MILSLSGKIFTGKDEFAKIFKKIDAKYQGGKTSFKDEKFANPMKDMICILLNCTRTQLEDRTFKETVLPEDWWYWELQREGGYSTIKLDYLTTSKKELSTYTGLRLITPTPRLLMQQLGTEAGKGVLHPKIWSKALISRYKPEKRKIAIDDVEEYETQYPNWIITDMRFTDEIEVVKQLKGITIRIERPIEILVHQWFKNLKPDEFSKLCIKYKLFNYSSKVFNYSYDIAKYIWEREQHKSETELDNYKEFDYIIYNDSSLEDFEKKIEKIYLDIFNI